MASAVKEFNNIALAFTPLIAEDEKKGMILGAAEASDARNNKDGSNNVRGYGEVRPGADNPVHHPGRTGCNPADAREDEE